MSKTAKLYLWLFLFSVLTLTGCGRSVAPSFAVQSPTAQWASSLTGVQPDILVVNRAWQYRAAGFQKSTSSQQNSGNAIGKLAGVDLDQITNAAWEQSQEQEVMIFLGNQSSFDMITILRQVPPTLDPRNPSAQGQTAWRLRGVSPSGAVAFSSSRGLLPLSLFLLPDRTWVIVSGQNVDRVGDVLSRQGYVPQNTVAPNFATYAYATGRKSGVADGGRDSLSVTPQYLLLLVDLRQDFRREAATIIFQFSSAKEADTAEKEIRYGMSAPGISSRGNGPLESILGAGMFAFFFDVRRQEDAVYTRMRMPIDLFGL